MKHKYLPAVEVDLTVELAGTEDQRILVFNIRCLSATSNLLMVLDQRGKLTYATSQLADAVGYPVKTLSRMDVKAIVPSPYTQLHDIWMKVRLSRPKGMGRTGHTVCLALFTACPTFVQQTYATRGAGC